MIDNLYEKQNKLGCWCRACCKRETGYPHLFRMVVCPTCGNKRCPKAANHVLECSGSNDPDQLAMTDEQLLEEYTKEIHGNYYSPSDNLTVAQLIDSHRHLRQQNREWYGEFDDARTNGYKFGYEMGLKCAAENTIQCDDLRKMTVQELANLLSPNC